MVSSRHLTPTRDAKGRYVTEEHLRDVAKLSDQRIQAIKSHCMSSGSWTYDRYQSNVVLWLYIDEECASESMYPDHKILTILTL